jgi:hypothetical protein
MNGHWIPSVETIRVLQSAMAAASAIIDDEDSKSSVSWPLTWASREREMARIRSSRIQVCEYGYECSQTRIAWILIHTWTSTRFIDRVDFFLLLLSLLLLLLLCKYRY